MKASALLSLLDEGRDDVLWIDSDVLAAGPLPASLAAADPATFVAAEEQWASFPLGDCATPWGLSAVRRLPAILNAGVLRATPQHRDLLEAWQEMLVDPAYLAAQILPWHDRPRHLFSDQILLEVLLSSRFAGTPVVLLRRGVDIAQCHGPAGFSPRERLHSRRSGRLPPLIHGQAIHPWDVDEEPAGSGHALRRYQTRLHQELSPYTALAAEYETLLDEDASWLHPKTRTARALGAATRHDPLLQELPLAAFNSAVRGGRRLLLGRKVANSGRLTA